MCMGNAQNKKAAIFIAAFLFAGSASSAVEQLTHLASQQLAHLVVG